MAASFAPLPAAASPGLPLAVVDTPALRLDLDAFERNLDRRQSAAAAAGVRLRPHAKAHECPAVARAQTARGAVGICCRKASGALPFLQAGIEDIHVRNELASPANAALPAQWARRTRISVCVDGATQGSARAAATQAADSRLGAFTELQPGCYAFMDHDDGDNERGDRLGFEHTLFVATTVMSTAAGTHGVVEAGVESLAVDSGLPVLWPAGGSLRCVQANDGHGDATASAG